MSNFVSLNNGKLINLDTVTRVEPISRQGFDLHFTNGEKVRLTEAESTAFLDNIRHLGVDVNLMMIAFSLGDDEVAEYRKRNSSLNLDILTERAKVEPMIDP